MDAKEITAALKSAREAIRTKEYKDALKHCKNILKVDKNNFHAMVFVGVAAEGLEQPDQALAAYKKATEINNESPLGWQGLCRFYEKVNKVEDSQDLIIVYQRLIELYRSDKNKCVEVKQKLCRLLENSSDIKAAVEVCESILSDVSEGEEKSRTLLQLVSYWKKLQSSNVDLRQKIENAYEELTEGASTVEIWMDYLSWVAGGDADGSHLSHIAERFSSIYPETVYPLEIRARVLLDELCGGHCMDDDALTELSHKLQSLDSENMYGKLMQGVQALHNTDLLKAKSLLSQCVGNLTSSVSGWYYMGKVAMRMHNKQQAYNAALQAQNSLQKGTSYYGSKPDIERNLQLLLIEACVEFGDQQHLQEAKKLLDQFRDASEISDTLLLKMRLMLALEQPNEALQLIESFCGVTSADLRALTGWVHHQLGHQVKAKSCLEEALAECPGSSIAHYYMGRIIFDEKSENQDVLKSCLTHLLKAAKLDPFWGVVFLHIGYYYGQILNDRNKSISCLQRAYDLDRSNEEAGSALIDGLMSTGKEDSALVVLNNVTSQTNVEGAKWAWLRLGLYHMKMNNLTEAIKSLQNVLRVDPENFHCWECLGQAYMSRGSYTAALKAFERATQLDDTSLYCYYQMATIKQTLNMNDEAVAQYKSILQNSNYVPALKGLGETYIQMTRVALKEFFDGRAVDYCQEAVTYLANAARQRPDLSCIWKLLGDACTLLAPIHASKIDLLVPVCLLSRTDDADEKVKVNKLDALALGGRCYGMAIKLQSECSALWQDLGVNYLEQSKISPVANKRKLVNSSMQCLQKAVSLDTENFQAWNALGVVVRSDIMDHAALAQHSFIQSIRAESNNVAAWTNLGVLYLKSGDIKKAHEVFKVAQALDPSYVACWIGQALIAEVVAHDEAMDLFRHTTELANHLEGALGYGHWVCKVLQESGDVTNSVLDYSIKQMAAIPAASDSLSKYLERITDNGAAYNLYGLLLERQKLYSLACKAFKSAMELLENDKDKSEMVRINYARVLQAAQRPKQSIEQYNKLSSLDTMDKVCGLGLALFDSGEFAESNDLYRKALSLAGEGTDPSDIHAALGMVAYAMGDIGKAKGELFAGSQFRDRSLLGLQALLGIGLIQKDTTLCAAVLQELEKCGESGPHVMLKALAAEVEMLSGNTTKANRLLQEAVHSNPEWSNSWMQLARHMLRPDINQPHLAAQCLSNVPSSAFDQKCTGEYNRSSQIFTQSKTLLASMSSLAAGHHGSSRHLVNNAFNLAQKAVHSDPTQLCNWFALLGSVHGEEQIRSKPSLHGLVLSLTTRLMARVENYLSHATGDKARLQELHVWCVKYYIVGLLQAGRVDQARQFLQQAVWLYENDVHLGALMAAFNQDFSRLKQLETEDRSSFSKQLLVSLYLMHGLEQEMEKFYNNCIDKAGTDRAKAGDVVQLAYFSFCKLVKRSAVAERSDVKKWQKLFNETSKLGCELEKNWSVLWLMRGLISLSVQKNVKSANQNLQKVLDLCTVTDIEHVSDLAKIHFVHEDKE